MKSSDSEIMKCTSKPEGGDKGDEDTGIDDSQDLLAELNPPLCLLPYPGLTGGVPECLDVGLEDDVHERFEEVKYQPVVYHLYVGRRGEVGAYTLIEIFTYKVFMLFRRSNVVDKGGSQTLFCNLLF